MIQQLAKMRGLRVVPTDPPAEFQFVEWACRERPRRCPACVVSKCTSYKPHERPR